MFKWLHITNFKSVYFSITSYLNNKFHPFVYWVTQHVQETKMKDILNSD